MSARKIAALVWFLALTPGLVVLIFMGPADFDSAGAVLNTAGRLTGILGLSMLLVAAALCCRVPGFDRPFGGLTKLWQLHHRIGAAAFLLLLAHPVFLSLAAADVSLSTSVATLFSNTPGLWLGWLALLSMMVFLAPSFAFFGLPGYQRWKWLHRLSGPAIVLALIHTLLLARTLPGIWNWILWTVFLAIALVALGYRWLFSRVWGRHRYLIDEVHTPANNVVELVLKPLGEPLDYVAGQFVYLTPYDKNLEAGYREEHPYTLSSAPGESGLRIAIKDLGNASRALQSVTPGTEVNIEGPYGDFFPRTEDGRPELWIAGGIGITPFLGRLRHLAREGLPADLHLVFCVQDESRALFLEELKTLVDRIEGASLSLHFFYREGPLSADFLHRHCPDLTQRHAYICGPVPLLHLARKLLIQAGVPQHCILTEEFVLL
ncbi:MAG: ferric reductase-like transmembrane domain-containing protein [Halioglobus sp.]|nr:ferric reductase-like transmembrane domain-containing protein [Halioglobus sp.]